VIGGRWKPLHHWLSRQVFTDVLVTCGGTSTSSLLCFVKNDGIYPIARAFISIESVDTITGNRTSLLLNTTYSIPAGPAHTTWFNIPAPPVKTSVIEALIGGETGFLTSNTILLTEPKNLQLKPLVLNLTVGNPGPNGVPVHIERAAGQGSQIALYTTLTTLANGRFSENAFTFSRDAQDIYFIPFGRFGDAELALLRSSIRVESVADYLHLLTPDYEQQEPIATFY